jgi:2,5-diketo-D-gluconate reductase A
VINQIELHPLLQQRQLHAWNATHKIQTESWSPLAQGGEGVFDQKIIHQLADKYGKTPAQIVIRWHLDSGLVVIPKSVTPSRIAENFNVWDFRLDKDELGEMAKLDQNKRLGRIRISSADNVKRPDGADADPACDSPFTGRKAQRHRAIQQT